MKTIFCSIHGYTHWEDSLITIINTAEFQRMKRIKQLAAVHHVFPGATHTRFEHSIGVGHLAECFAKRLIERHPTLPICAFTLKLAGLCHDLGHGPLSHGYDAFLCKTRPEIPMHEFRSVILLRRLVEKYSISIPTTVLDNACELIAPSSRNLPTYLYQMISNEIDGIDVDKLDYLCRDSRHTGMRYDIDVHRFFEYARIIDGRLCYSLNMVHTIAHMLSVRHHLHAQVYQHRVVRAIEHMYVDILHLFGEVAYEAFTLTDTIFAREFAELQFVKGAIDLNARNLIFSMLDAIDERRLYACVLEMPIPSSIAYSDLDPSLASLPRKYFVDRVTIGYRDNPLFHVAFYDKHDRVVMLDPIRAPCLMALRMQDRILRIYRANFINGLPARR